MPVDTENPNRGVEAGRPTFRSNKTELKIKQVRCRQKCHGAISFFERRKFGNLMKWFADGMDDLSLKQGLVLKAWAHMLVQLQTFTFSACRIAILHLWTQRWSDMVSCPLVASSQYAVFGFPDPTWNHRFCFFWCRSPTHSTGPPHNPLLGETEVEFRERWWWWW